MKELKPVKETYYLLDGVSEDNLDDDLERLNDEIDKYGLFLQYYELEMKTSLNHVLKNYSKYMLHLLYENRNQQKKELNFVLSTNLVIKNNFKNRKTDIVVLNNIELLDTSKGYYQFGDQYLVPASVF